MVKSAKSPIGGKGTTNKLPKFISETEIGDSSVDNTTVDSISARDAAIAAHAALLASHGRTSIDGVTERDAAIAAHKLLTASTHNLDPNGNINPIYNHENQIWFKMVTLPPRVCSLFTSSDGGFGIGSNCSTDDGITWNRGDTSIPSQRIHFRYDGTIAKYIVGAGANPISWSVANFIDGVTERDAAIAAHAALTASVHGIDANGKFAGLLNTDTAAKMTNLLSGAPTLSGWTSNPVGDFTGLNHTVLTTNGNQSVAGANNYVTYDLGVLGIYNASIYTSAGYTAGSGNTTIVTLQISLDNITWITISSQSQTLVANTYGDFYLSANNMFRYIRLVISTSYTNAATQTCKMWVR